MIKKNYRLNRNEKFLTKPRDVLPFYTSSQNLNLLKQMDTELEKFTIKKRKFNQFLRISMVQLYLVIDSPFYNNQFSS